MPVEASASFAAPPEQKEEVKVQVEASDKDNATDRVAAAAPVETTGTALAADPVVQLVDAEEFNEIDRKADDGPPLSTNMARGEDVQTPTEQATTSWLQWIWSALGRRLGVLVAAVHQLIIG